MLKVGRISAVALNTKVGKEKVKLTAGANYYSTEDKGSFTGRREGTGVDAQLSFGPAEFHAEWLENQKHPVTGAAVTSNGWAALAAWNFSPKWQGLVIHDRYDSNTAMGATTTTEWTYGLSYLLKGDDLKLSLNYIMSQQPTPRPDGNLFLTRMQMVF